MSENASGNRNTGYTFGAGDLVARIYDKTIEIKISQKEWFKDIWITNGWDGKTPITRVEFQARRELLKDYSVDSFSSLLCGLGDIWRYFTLDWLTIREVNKADSERCRWPVKEWWQVVQGVIGKFGTCTGMVRFRQKQCKEEHLEKMFDGLMVSLQAKYSLVYGDHFAETRLKERFNANLDSSDYKFKLQERKSKMANLSN